MERIKDRIGERDSPIKSLKALAEAIGMSEGGFYMMFKKGTMKLKTKEAICTALNVSQSYFDNDDIHLDQPSDSFGNDVLLRINKEMQEMRQVFEEELKAKNLQIAGLQRMLESVLGKSEGVINELLTETQSEFNGKHNDYVGQVQLAFSHLLKPTIKTTNRNGKGVGTHFSHAEKTLIVK